LVDSLKALDPNRPIREADMTVCTAHVRFRGKADMTFCDANVRLWPKADIAAPKQTAGRRVAPTAKSMNDFARLVAAREIFPGFAFSFKTLDPTVLVHHPPMPKCVIAIVWAIYTVNLIVILVSHDDAYSAKILEPASSAVPKAADNYYGDNDKKSCGVHIVLLLATNADLAWAGYS